MKLFKQRSDTVRFFSHSCNSGDRWEGGKMRQEVSPRRAVMVSYIYRQGSAGLQLSGCDS